VTGEAHTKICVVACALAAGAGLDVVLSPSRKQRAVMARMAAAIMLREHGLSYPHIGRRLGFRHHTTVMHYLARAKQMPEVIGPVLERARAFMRDLEQARQRSSHVSLPGQCAAPSEDARCRLP